MITDTWPCRVFLAISIALSAELAVAQTALVAEKPAEVASQEIPTASPEAVGMSSAKLAVVDETIQGYVDSGELIGGIVLIARKGKICFFEDYGLANREKGQAMRKDSILRIYSMTKAITTASALMLHDEGKLDVNAPVSKYIPELGQMKVMNGDEITTATKQMTVADLMRHTSGLTYGWDGGKLGAIHQKHDPINKALKLSEMTGRLQNIPLRFEPSSGWVYGISTDVLGRVVEVVSGQTLDAFMQSRLFGPLDMKDTGFHLPKEKQSRFAACYELKKDATEFTLAEDENEKYATEPMFKSGGGGLVSTARDYMRFLMMIERGGKLDGRRYLKRETVKLMTTNQTPKEAGWVRFGDEIREGVGFGFGFCVRDKMSDWDPGGRVGEYGWGGAASTHYWISPKDELIVVTMEQMKPYRWLTEFGVKKQIYDAIIDSPANDNAQLDQATSYHLVSVKDQPDGSSTALVTFFRYERKTRVQRYTVNVPVKKTRTVNGKEQQYTVMVPEQRSREVEYAVNVPLKLRSVPIAKGKTAKEVLDRIVGADEGDSGS